jgi:hypothetical protein
MTSVDEVRAALSVVAAGVQSAYEHAGVARAGIDEALAALEKLGAQTSEPLPPPQLRRAVDELEHGLGLIHAGAGMVADIVGRL